MQKRIKDLVSGDLVILDTGIERVKQVISDTPNFPEWRIQWTLPASNTRSRVDFLPSEWVIVLD